MQSYNTTQTNSQKSASATAHTELFQEPLIVDINSNYKVFRHEIVIINYYYFGPHKKIKQIFFSSYILMIVCENVHVLELQQ